MVRTIITLSCCPWWSCLQLSPIRFAWSSFPPCLWSILMVCLTLSFLPLSLSYNKYPCILALPPFCVTVHTAHLTDWMIQPWDRFRRLPGKCQPALGSLGVTPQDWITVNWCSVEVPASSSPLSMTTAALFHIMEGGRSWNGAANCSQLHSIKPRYYLISPGFNQPVSCCLSRFLHPFTPTQPTC